MNKIFISQKSDNWYTPPEVYKQLNYEFKFDFDPCPLKSDFNGLNIDWGKRVFCNPPYSNIIGFLKKADLELKKKTELIVFLIPARTDVKWFHEYVYKRSEIRFIKGRLKFGGAKFNAPFPSMIVIFKKENNNGEG